MKHVAYLLLYLLPFKCAVPPLADRRGCTILGEPIKQTIVQFSSQNKFPNESDGTTRNLDRGGGCRVKFSLGVRVSGMIRVRVDVEVRVRVSNLLGSD